MHRTLNRSQFYTPFLASSLSLLPHGMRRRRLPLPYGEPTHYVLLLMLLHHFITCCESIAEDRLLPTQALVHAASSVQCWRSEGNFSSQYLFEYTILLCKQSSQCYIMLYEWWDTVGVITTSLYCSCQLAWAVANYRVANTCWQLTNERLFQKTTNSKYFNPDLLRCY